MAKKACHAFGSTTRFGLTQVLALTMDTLTFIAEIVKALAWPAAAFGITLLFQKQLRALLERIRKGKFGSAEVEFEREVSEIAEQAPLPITAPSTASSPVVSLAANNPRAAILEAWLRVESAAHRLAYHNNLPAPSVKRTTASILRSLEKSGLLTSEDIFLFNDLRGLRNKAVHDGDFSPSSDSAIQYVQLADALIQRLDAAAGNR